MLGIECFLVSLLMLHPQDGAANGATKGDCVAYDPKNVRV